MLSRGLTSAAMVLAASSLVSAQTFTDCNPMEKTCSPDPALGNSNGECDFTAGECDLFELADGTKLDYGDKGAVFTINTETNAPTIATGKRIFFGKVEVEMQAAQGQGIITSVVLESKDLDEIDWEWIGGDNTQVQSNYYGKGDTTTYDRAEYHDISTPLTENHKYTIEWTKDQITWAVDDSVLRTLKYADAKGGSRYPQTPMEVKLGTWVGGGKNSNPGTVEWAGGYTDFSKAPFKAYYKSVSITDYAGGDAATKQSIKQYVWSDKTGSYESIKVVKGDGSSSSDDDDKTTSSADATSTASKPSSTSEKESSTKASSSEKATSTSSDDESSTSGSASASATGSSGAQSTTLARATTGASSTGSDSATPTSSSDSETTPTDAPGSAAPGLFASMGSVAFAALVALAI